MRTTVLLWLLFPLTLVAQTTPPVHEPTIDALCDHLPEIGEVQASTWYSTLLDEELPALAAKLTAEEAAAYREATGRELTDDVSAPSAVFASILGELLERCPAASERYFRQHAQKGDATLSLLQLPEWKTALEAGVALGPRMLAQNEKIIAYDLIHRLRDSVPAALDTLEELRSADEAYLELLTGVARRVPGLMRRHQREKYEQTVISPWTEEQIGSKDNAYITELELTNDFEKACSEIAAKGTLTKANDINPNDFTVDDETVRRLDVKYGEGQLSHPVLRLAASQLLMTTLLKRCDPFKTQLRAHTIDKIIDELEPTPEERETFIALADAICACIGQGVNEEGKACFMQTLASYGLTEESTGPGGERSPETERLMQAVSALMPGLSVSCLN